jgi:hypothetical protein
MKSVDGKLPALVTRADDKWLIVPVLLALLGSGFLAEPRTLATTVLTFALFALPGFLVARSFTSGVRAVVYGLPLGYSLTSLLIMTAVAVHGWDMKIIIPAYALGVGMLWALVHFARMPSATTPLALQRESLPAVPPIVALGTGLLVLLLSVPFDHAGSLTSRGYAFTGLFGHDFILRSADSVALANAIPSDNYFLAGVKTANYYLLWYVLPATIYNLLGKHGEITSIVSVVSLLNVPIFTLLVYYSLAAFLRTVTGSAPDSLRIACVFMALFIFCYSYHWVFFLLTQLLDASRSPSLARLSTTMGPVSTSWVKDFLFQPHSILALAQLLVVMHLALVPSFRLRAIWMGILLGALLLTDTVVFLVAGCAFALWYVTRKDALREIRELVLLTASFAAIVALGFFVRILVIPEYSNKIVLSPYVAAIAALPALLALCFGPLPLFSALALKQKGWAATEQWRLLLLLLLVSLFFMLFVTEVLEGNVFLRKSLMTLRLPLIILSAAYLYTSLLSPRRVSRVALVLSALAVPTLFTDLYASSIADDGRYTMYVNPDDMAAAAWLRTHTRPDAVVQSLIEYPAPYEYSLTVCFGERKAALGLWKMAYQRYPNKEEIARRVHEIQTLFSTSSIEERERMAHALHIDYVFIGSHERARFPGVDTRFAADAAHFREAYASGTVRIYEVTS